MSLDPLSPIPDREFDFWSAAHLLRRAGFGGTPSEIGILHAAGRDGAIARLVEYQPHPDDDHRAVADIMRPQTPEERAELTRAREAGDEATLERYRKDRQNRQRRDREQLAAMRRWWFDRMVTSPNPLEEKMTLFWHGHYATGYRTIEDSWHLLLQNRLFRRFAVGDARWLAVGILRDPAMVRYLDGQRNVRGNPNENLARELMELFILGEGNAYTERDIKEVARCLTGLDVEDDTVVFRSDRHDPGVKNVLGRRGEFAGDQVLPVLFARPEAASFLAEKLYRFFVNDAPGDRGRDAQNTIAGLARLLRRHDFELAPVLTRLFASRHFHDPANRGAVMKSPMQLLVQAIRGLGTPPRDVNRLLDDADRMGQSLFQPPSVKGWDGGRAWINTATLFVRQNVLVHLLVGEGETAAAFPAERLITHLSQDGPPDPDSTVDYLLRFCLGTEPHPRRRQQVRAFVSDIGDRIDRDRLVAMLALITAFPEYQLC
jgi:uncharacterized protein (DUF1800 family)